MTTAAPPPTERRPNARGAARREALIDAAVRLFSERGFRGTGIIGLAREVGMTHVGLLHHFGTKEQLLREVVAQRDRQQVEVFAAMAGRRGLDTLGALDLIAANMLADPTLSRLSTVLVGENLQADDPLNEYFRDRHILLRLYFEDGVRTGQEDGTVCSDVDARLVAAEIASFIVGTQTQYLLDAERIDVAAMFSDFTASLLVRLAESED